MSKLFAWILFIGIEMLSIPFVVVGCVLFAVDFIINGRNGDIAMTAYEPLMSRWMLHALGKRKDDACEQLFYTLPGASRLSIGLLAGPSLLAVRMSGLELAPFRYPVQQSDSMYGIVTHRTTFFDRVIQQVLDKVDQLVILGAGWDTRAYHVANTTDIAVYEVDTAQMQARKRRTLAAANIDDTRVTFASADFNKESWLDALKRVGFDPNKATFVLWEGVTFYLDPGAVEDTLRSLATQLAQGSAIAFDYPDTDVIAGKGSVLYRLSTLYLRFTGEPWTFGISTRAPAQEQVERFLEHNGLKLSAYEPLGGGDDRKKPFGGVVLATNHTPV